MTSTESIPRTPTVGDFLPPVLPQLRGVAALSREAVGRLRAWLALRGVLGLVLGVMILVWPGITVEAFALLVGIFFCIIGVARIVLGAVDSAFSAGIRVLNVILGLLLAGIGAVSIRYPGFGLLATVLLIGFAWIIEGAAALSLMPPPKQGRALAITFGVISLLAGGVLIIWPVESIFPLAIVAGVALVLGGILDIAQAFTLKRPAAARAD
ncbi:MAG: DUF308 domain-containing protein [Bifidobacteriaceae bacterium]|jgi:uncharacterized membrane protein HdeD (DUF308 family)|nr:DUF308 domain-containing protein [Bifidobacteriaceae bacterium]